MDVEQELAELKSKVRHLLDRQEILDVIVRESRGRDRNDLSYARPIAVGGSGARW